MNLHFSSRLPLLVVRTIIDLGGWQLLCTDTPSIAMNSMKTSKHMNIDFNIFISEIKKSLILIYFI